jgi:hypothetical protein
MKRTRRQSCEGPQQQKEEKDEEGMKKGEVAQKKEEVKYAKRKCWVPVVPPSELSQWLPIDYNTPGAKPIVSCLVEKILTSGASPHTFPSSCCAHADGCLMSSRTLARTHAHGHADMVVAPEVKFDHKSDLTCFGGMRPWLRSAEQWPRCGNAGCANNLWFLFQVDFRFVPAEALFLAGGGIHAHHCDALARPATATYTSCAAVRVRLCVWPLLVLTERNRLLQMFICENGCETWEAFDPSVLLRFVPLPSPASGDRLLDLAARAVARALRASDDPGTESAPPAQ